MRHIFLGITYLLCTLGTGYAASTEQPEQITIHLFDYFGLTPRAIAAAQRSAGAVFRQSGIEVVWRDCRAATSKPASGRGCAGLARESTEVTEIFVSLLTKGMSARLTGNPKQFGSSATSRAGGFATHAYIFMDRVLDFADAESAAPAEILALVILHEVGHLLLGNDSHSSTGIMRGKWTREDVKQALMGVLTFTVEQSERMTTETRRRMNVREMPHTY